MATRKKKIAVDDGHGIETAGKRTPFIPEIQREIRENEFNEAVAELLVVELKRNGFDVIETAPTKADTPLLTRVKTANDAKADLFISIHYNAIDGKFDGPGKDPEGFSAHIDPSRGESEKFAKIALRHLANGTVQKNRGVVLQQLYVTSQTKMPAVLFELGFMDNHREALLMIDKSFQRECAMELAMAVCEYYGKKYVPEHKTPSVIKPDSKAVKIGELVTLRDVPAYARPEFGTQLGRVVKKGEKRNVYAIKNGWYQLFSGEWLPANYGNNFTYDAVKKTEPPTAIKPQAQKDVRRVIVDGKQAGAFREESGIIQTVKEALEKNPKSIEVKKK